MVFKTKIKGSILYFIYRFKTFFKIKIAGYKPQDNLIILRLLPKYKLPKHSMNVLKVSDDLTKVDLNEIYLSELKINKDNFISIIINVELKQASLVIGKNLKESLNTADTVKINQIIQSKFKENEILLGLELGMKEIKKITY